MLSNRMAALIVILLLFAQGVALAERTDGGYYRLVDEAGETLTMTSRHLDVGTRYRGG